MGSCSAPPARPPATRAQITQYVREPLLLRDALAAAQAQSTGCSKFLEVRRGDTPAAAQPCPSHVPCSRRALLCTRALLLPKCDRCPRHALGRMTVECKFRGMKVACPCFWGFWFALEHGQGKPQGCMPPCRTFMRGTEAGVGCPMMLCNNVPAIPASCEKVARAGSGRTPRLMPAYPHALNVGWVSVHG
jgi:hypothetical protein